ARAASRSSLASVDNGDRVDDPLCPRSPARNRFRCLTNQIGVDLAGQIHDAVERLNANEVGWPKVRMLIEQRLYLGGDRRIARAALETTFAIAGAPAIQAEHAHQCNERSEHSHTTSTPIISRHHGTIMNGSCH